VAVLDGGFVVATLVAVIVEGCAATNEIAAATNNNKFEIIWSMLSTINNNYDNNNI
jgi:hypothetical protein